MTFKGMPCQWTQAAQVTPGKLHVVIPATKAIPALMFPPSHACVSESSLCCRVSGLAQVAKVH